MRALPALVLLLLPLAACQTPPAKDYAHGTFGAAHPAAQVSIGRNAVGEECTQAAGEGRSADIYCGTWAQPSARVRQGGPAGAQQLMNLATASPWRAGLDTRFRCEAPQTTTILNNSPAALMQCTQLVGGWAHVALVALVNGHAWYADGVLPAAKVMEHSIGVLSGVATANATPVSSAADALLARRLAAQAFSSGDIGQYNALMSAGTRANLADNPGAAENAFRAALAIQQKALGKNNPNTVTAMMSLALELSDEGRFADADSLFDQAEALVPRSDDPTAQPRLVHYRGLDALNQNKLEDAEKLLTQADALYAAQVPQSALKARPVAQVGNRFLRIPVSTSDLMPSQELLTDPRAQSALLGLVEVRRYRSIVLRLLGKPKQADALLQSATDLARGNGLARPMLTARLYRTSALTAEAQGLSSQALSDLSRSTEAFSRALPGSKPLAETYLLHVRELE
ncbi:MAG TPA: tetratricopeptide repeat protein, partial [Acetobacteraceae bacterium]|nr:tetratricopeptide repeat protein [Acetobacteraceae bacterium]